MILSGSYEHTLDEKGRVSLPARHRAEIGDIIVLWPGLDGQINVYPLLVWQQVVEAVSSQNRALGSVRDLVRILCDASDCQVDRQGRILIPASLRDNAKLDTDVIILGAYDHLEIWSQERWRELRNRLNSDGKRIAESLAELGLKM